MLVLNKLFDIDAFRAEILPTETEIMANWQGDIEKPVVSVLCNTYNQKMYIEDAFRGFLTQQTDFVFEVIVHDDASTDCTSDIVRDYAARYPKIFKPVIQTENQYSQGNKITSLAASYAKGKYIAICEGDDFWIEKSKLQKQFQVLEMNGRLDMVVSSAIGLFPDGKTTRFSCISENDFTITFASAIVGTKKDFLPTATFFFKRSVFFDLPDWFYNIAPVADYYIQVFAARRGGIYFLSTPSAVYRRDAVGSWSSSLNYEKEMVDQKRRVLCNRLLSEEFSDDPSALLALREKALVYKKRLLINSYRRRDVLKLISCFFSFLWSFFAVNSFFLKKR